MPARPTTLINRALGTRGYRIAQVPLVEPLEAEFTEIAARSAGKTMVSRERLYANYVAARHIVRAGIEGVVVECGVWRGGSAMIFAETLMRHDDIRPIWLFDTYAGMTEPTDHDVSTLGHKDTWRLWREQQAGDVNEWCYAPIEEVRENLAFYPNMRFVKGPVEETIPAEVPETIAILRLDTDWYESSRHELEHLYPRLARGGVLLLDDYGAWAGQRKAVDEYLAEHDPGMMLTRVDATGRVGVKL